MSIEYYIIDPAGNITALVVTAVNKALYKDISRQIMAENPGVEQVGFVRFENGVIKLNMAGDEFCGNAAMSAAVLESYILKTKAATAKTVVFEPFGLKVMVNAEGAGSAYAANCLIPLPDKVSNISFFAGDREYTFPLVCLKGIMHIIADASLPPADAKSIIKALAKRLKTPALGIMIFNSESRELTPLVYVSAVDTVFFENACASGTCALAAALNIKNETGIIQPGGVITASIKENGVFLSLHLTVIKHCFKE